MMFGTLHEKHLGIVQLILRPRLGISSPARVTSRQVPYPGVAAKMAATEVLLLTGVSVAVGA